MEDTMGDLHTQFFLDALKEGYDDIGNPIFAWEALKICREESLPIPEWALKYFEEAASSLLDVAEKARNPDDNSKKRPSTEIPKALRMNKRGSIDVFDQYNNYFRDQEIIRGLCNRLVKDTPDGIMANEILEDAKKNVAKEKLEGFGQKFVTEVTVYRVYRKWKRRVLME
jgi:hypothetical protein